MNVSNQQLHNNEKYESSSENPQKPFMPLRIKLGHPNKISEIISKPKPIDVLPIRLADNEDKDIKISKQISTVDQSQRETSKLNNVYLNVNIYYAKNLQSLENAISSTNKACVFCASCMLKGRANCPPGAMPAAYCCAAVCPRVV